MDEILEMRRRNEEIALKFLRIEGEISTAGDAAELFETLIAQIEEKFGIPFVWVSIVDRPDLSELIRLLQSSEILRDRINTIDEEAFLSLTRGGALPVLVNENLKPYYRLLPQNNKYLIRSLAVAPLSLRGGIVGSINHGDSSALRYEPSMDATLLGRMAAKVSDCLSRLLPVSGPSVPRDE